MTLNVFILLLLLLLVSYLRNHYLTLRSQRFTPLFSSKSSVILAYIFRSLIYFNLIFVYDMRQVSNFLLLYMDIQLFKHYLKRLLFPYYFLWSWHLYQKSVIKNTYVYLCLIHVDVWQKSSHYCKVIFLQLKVKLNLKNQ